MELSQAVREPPVTRRVEIADIEVATSHGPFTVRVYRGPRRNGLLPCIVWAHGGAFMFGDLDELGTHWLGIELADRGIVVVSVGYSTALKIDLSQPLPPVDEVLAAARRAAGRGESAVFPTALDECIAAFDWAHAHAEEFGVDARSISIGGSSAGGALMAGASLKLRDRGGRTPRSTVLLYPVPHADLVPPSAELAATLADLPPEAWLSDEMADVVNLNYLGDPAHLRDPYAFAALASDHFGLPPALIINSEFDRLRASGEEYGRLLAEAGVAVSMLTEPGTSHDHIAEVDSPAALRTVARVCAWLATHAYIDEDQTAGALWFQRADVRNSAAESPVATPPAPDKVPSSPTS